VVIRVTNNMIRATSLVFLDEELYRAIWKGCDGAYIMDKISEKIESNGLSRSALIEEIRNSSGSKRRELTWEIAEELIEYVTASKIWFEENFIKPKEPPTVYFKKE
jgi:hypothetical protein